MAASPIVDMPDLTSLPAQITPAISQSSWPLAVSFLIFIAFMVIAIILSLISGKGLQEGPSMMERRSIKKKRR